MFLHDDCYDLYMDHLADEVRLDPIGPPKPPKVKLSPRKIKKIVKKPVLE